MLVMSEFKFVQTQAITTLATVADAAGPPPLCDLLTLIGRSFGKYYNSIMPNLMAILKTPYPKEYRLMKGKVMECATLIALAVGKQLFLPHAHEFIEILKQGQLSCTDDDDPQVRLMGSLHLLLCFV